MQRTTKKLGILECFKRVVDLLYTVTFMPKGSRVLKLRIHHFSCLCLNLVVASRVGSPLMVSNIWKLNLAGL